MHSGNMHVYVFDINDQFCSFQIVSECNTGFKNRYPEQHSMVISWKIFLIFSDIFFSRIFQVKPRLGLIQAKHQLFAVRKSPRELNTKLNHSFRWLLNESEKHTLDILVQGSSEQPAVLLDSQVSHCPLFLFFLSSPRFIKLRNHIVFI